MDDDCRYGDWRSGVGSLDDDEESRGSPHTAAARLMMISMVKTTMVENCSTNVRGRRLQKTGHGKLAMILAQVVLALMLMPVQRVGAVSTKRGSAPQRSTGFCDLFVRSSAYKCSEIVVSFLDDGEGDNSQGQEAH